MARTSRRRRRRDTEDFRSVVLKGVATIAVLVAFLALAITANKGVPGRNYTKMYVSAAESGSLRAHDKVAIGGVRVGQVVKITPQTQGARVELQLEPHVPLPRDTQVAIRANGLLGARYVQLIPGSSRTMLKPGSTIKGAPDALTSSVPDALDVFDAQTRGSLGIAVRNLGRGVLGNGDDLNDAIRVSSKATVPFTSIMTAIESHPGAARSLIPDLDSAVTPLYDARRPLGQMLEPAATALRPFADQRSQLRSALDELPPTMTTAQGGLNHGRTLLAAVGQLALSAQRTLPTAPAGLRQATALLQEARQDDKNGSSPLEKATALLKTAGPAVPNLLKTTRVLKPVLPRLDDAMGGLTPVLTEVTKHGCDVINTGEMLRSMTGMVGTGTGPNGPSSGFRLQALGGPETLGIKDPTSARVAYPAPCSGVSHPFAITPGTSSGPGG